MVVVHGFWMLAAVRGVFGLAQAGTYPILGQLTRHWFPPQVRTAVQGVIAAMGRVGGAAASLVIATILMSRLGLSWRTALLVLACPGLLLGVGVWFVVRLNPAQHPWTNAAERGFLADPDAPPPGKSAGPFACSGTSPR